MSKNGTIPILLLGLLLGYCAGRESTPDPPPRPAPNPASFYQPSPTLPRDVYRPEPEYREPAPVYAVPQARTPSAYFQNCSEARAAGAAPIMEGEPGYARRLDRDGDGVACE
jgi:hypothetical protein